MNTVITYLFGDADFLRDPLVVTANTQYVVFTDRIDLNSSVWKPYIISYNEPLDIRAKVASAKFNPYIISSDKYVIIDASHQIISDLNPLFDSIKLDTLLVKPHPANVTIGEEIIRWKTIRHMNQHHIDNIGNLLDLAGKSYYNAPIYEGCCIGVSNSLVHRSLFECVLKMLCLLQNDGVWFPSNQIVLSFLISKLHIKIMPMNIKLFANRYHHKTWKQIYE